MFDNTRDSVLHHQFFRGRLKTEWDDVLPKWIKFFSLDTNIRIGLNDLDGKNDQPESDRPYLTIDIGQIGRAHV